MYLVSLKGGKSFYCDENDTIISASLKSGIFLNHSCLIGRCSSCKFQVLSGLTRSEIEEVSLTGKEKADGFILSCIRKPLSDIYLDAEDLSEYGINQVKTIPAKIESIENLTEEISKFTLRLPPNQKPSFLEGQYINVIKGDLKRSYSIASTSTNENLELIVKNYPDGKMSQYWFNESKINDLLRIEIPKGTFFFRNHIGFENLIFLATGTGIAPIKSIFENLILSGKIHSFKRVLIFWGMKYAKDIFWNPDIKNDLKVEFIPVLSREGNKKRYVQNELLKRGINYSKSIVYACGSNDMIIETNNMLISNGLVRDNFFSDAFVPSN